MQTFKNFRTASHAAARGFTLIEVLMAVLVLALALTGVMRMHLVALRAQQQSSYRISAMQLANDMAEMIRAWHAPADDHPFLFDYQSGDTIPAANNCIDGALCDPSALRQFGVAQWLASVKATLPMARVTICRDTMPWDSASGSAIWRCSGGRGAGIVIKLGWRPATGDPRQSSDTQRGPQLVLNVGEPGNPAS